MLETLFTGFIGGVCAWFFTDFVTKPFRRFFDLRREVNRRLVEYGNVLARAKMDGNMRVPLDISPAEDARLTEAQVVFRRLAGDMRAFANVDYFANRMVSYFGYDADNIASALIGYSNDISTYGAGRAHHHDRVQKLLRIHSES
jgi:hypothetical protein